MKYLLIEYFYITSVYFNTFTVTLPIDKQKNNNNIGIDEFIRQLLKSQKFDELADKIAEKAVSKIIVFEQHTDSKTTLNIKNASINKVTHQNHEKPHEKSGKYSYKAKDEKQMEDIGKINMQSLMKKDASLNAENLSLKYKYLTKDIGDQKEADARSSPVLRNNDKASVEIENESILQENKDNDKQDVDTSHDMSSDQSERHSGDFILTNLYHKDVAAKADYEETERSESKDDMTKEDTESIKKPEYNLLKTMRISEVDFKMKPNNKTSKDDATKSNEHSESSEHAGDSSKKKDSNENKLIEQEHAHFRTEDSMASEDKHNETEKNRIRMEGDKMLKFQSSPDYDEYHNEYEKARKPKLEDFL